MAVIYLPAELSQSCLRYNPITAVLQVKALRILPTPQTRPGTVDLHSPAR
jgi:hypothetical protein